MKAVNVAVALIAALLLLPVAGHAHTAVPDLRVPDDIRTIEGGRKVLIVMQSVRSGSDNPLASTVSRVQAPLRAVLTRDEFETKMPAKLAAVVNAIPWVGARDVEITRDFRWAEIERALDASNTRQMLVLRTEHSLNPDFKSMRIWVRALLLNRQIPKGRTSHARFTQDWTPYQLDFTVWLSPPGADVAGRAANRKAWAATDGELARKAIESGIEWIGARLARTLTESEPESRSWLRRGETGGTLPVGIPGWILEQTPAGYSCFESRRRSLTWRGTVSP